MKAILTGATGNAGSAVLRRCIADPGIERVTVLSRRAFDPGDAKARVLVLQDFEDYAPISAELAEHDACFWCLGIAQSQVTKAEYEKITFGYATAAAKALFAIEPKMVFCFLSGGGADSSEKSRILFARVKGKTENALMAMSDRVYCFRPGYIRPSQPLAQRRFSEKVADLIGPLLRKISTNLAIDSDELARAMIRVARDGAETRVLENTALRRLAD